MTRLSPSMERILRNALKQRPLIEGLRLIPRGEWKRRRGAQVAAHNRAVLALQRRGLLDEDKNLTDEGRAIAVTLPSSLFEEVV